MYSGGNVNYSEKIEYLKKIDQLSTSDPEIQRRYNMIKQELYEFECNVFNVILKEIQNEKQQIEFLNNQIEQASNDELFKTYCNDKINQHKEKITAYGNQIYSMYTREQIIEFYNTRQIACKEKIEYWKKDMISRGDNKVAEVNLNGLLIELEEINIAINLLNGNDINMLQSYLNTSDIGKKM